MDRLELERLAGRTDGKLIDHTELQRQVIAIATMTGWEHMHVRAALGRRDGRRAMQTPTSVDGWPDLVLWHEQRQMSVACEIKVPPDWLKPDQQKVLGSLARAGWVSIVVLPGSGSTLSHRGNSGLNP